MRSLIRVVTAAEDICFQGDSRTEIDVCESMCSGVEQICAWCARGNG